MGFCPYLSGIALKEEEVKKEDGSVEKKRVYEIIEIDCQKEKCEFYNSEEERCNLLFLGEILPIKKALQNISINLHDDLYNIQHETSQRISDLGEKLDKIPELVGSVQVDFDSVTSKIDSVIDEKIIPELRGYGNSINEVGNRFVEALSSVREEIINTMDRNGVDLKERVVEKIDALRESIKAFEEVIGTIPERIGQPMNELKESVSPFFESLDADMKKLLELFDVLMKKITEASGEVTSRVETLNEGINRMDDNLRSSLETSSNSLKEGLEGMRDGFKEFSTQLESMAAKMEEFSVRASEYLQELRERLNEMEEKDKVNQGMRLNDEGVLDFYAGDISSAIEKFRKAIELAGRKREILINLAMALSKSGENEEAREILEEILNENPDDVDAILTMGVISFNKGAEEEALALMEKARNVEENPLVIANLGFVYEKMGNIDRALEMWEKALSMDSSLIEVEEAINRYKERRI